MGNDTFVYYPNHDARDTTILFRNYPIDFVEDIPLVYSNAQTVNGRPATWLFDFGDTLFEPLPEQFSRANLVACAGEVGLTHTEEELHQVFQRAKRTTSEQIGKQTFYRHTDYIAAAFQLCCERLGTSISRAVAQGYAVAQRDAVIEHLRPRADCERTLRSLREKGMRLGIVSNIDNDWLDPLIEKWDIGEWVDGILTSETAQSCKPDEQIFKLACEQHRCIPGSVVFVGDDEVNDIEGASRFGMHTVLLSTAGASSQADCVVLNLEELLYLGELL